MSEFQSNKHINTNWFCCKNARIQRKWNNKKRETIADDRLGLQNVWAKVIKKNGCKCSNFQPTYCHFHGNHKCSRCNAVVSFITNFFRILSASKTFSIINKQQTNNPILKNHVDWSMTTSENHLQTYSLADAHLLYFFFFVSWKNPNRKWFRFKAILLLTSTSPKSRQNFAFVLAKSFRLFSHLKMLMDKKWNEMKSLEWI